MMTTNTNKEMARQKRKVNHMEDRLSNLPDVILTQILSHLRTKETVRTGILSTRWKSVWASVPTLDLFKSDFKFKGEGSNVDDDQKVEARFLSFMDRVLIARKLPSFEKISIGGSKVDPYVITSWIRAALERNLSELDVNFSVCSVAPPCELTQTLFSGNKLVVLKLRVDLVLYFPMASSCFPNLRVLELCHILYRDDDSVPNLLSSCPVLEDLLIIRSHCDNLGTLNLTSRSLKRLKVSFTFDDFDERVDVLKMVFDASAVECLDIFCGTTKEYVVKDLSSIVEAKLDLFDFYNSSDLCINLVELLRGISNVKFLTLESNTMEFLSFANPPNLPMFHNLTRLEIMGDDRSDLWTWKLMIEILKSSPLLEILILQAFTFSTEERCKASEWDVPNCLVSHLKTVEISYYHSHDDDVEKVRYFLINAQVLERMTIRYYLGGEKLKLGICDVILKNTKGSVTWSNREIIISFI